MNGEFPFPQTLGRTRELNTVAPDPNQGRLARPTQFEAQSLLTQVGDYVNNWLGNVTTANRAKDAESITKAAKVSGATSPGHFSTIVDQRSFSQAFQTIADAFLKEPGVKVSSVEPGSTVPGRPVSTTTTHYQYANKIDKSIEDIRSAGEAFVAQVKGLFNIAYEGPQKPVAVQATSIGGIGAAGGGALLVMLAILYGVLS